MSKLNYIDEIVGWEEEFTFYHPVSVRFSETDMFGHLNNTVPFVYFEEARIEYFKSLGFMQTWLQPENETIPVVADLQCDFLKQVFFGANLKIYVKANTIGNSSVDIHYMGKGNDGKIYFTGRGTVVQMSKRTGKGFPWTDEMKNTMANKVKARA
ncbi:acyl-CoA thioesterase [Mesobacillus harenae]|uniref:acyl-CoA thioesterase n=1 Tax=Mesobacillus harenae TaxID=2213203 RepID=UPI001580E320|nr:thioesterase family protein [Mesobacillus harenae]